MDWCKERSKPYNDNINVYSPDMQLVLTVGKPKAEWYVTKKGLASAIEWRTPEPAPPPDCSPLHFETTGEQEMAAMRLKFAADFARCNDAQICRNLE